MCKPLTLMSNILVMGIASIFLFGFCSTPNIQPTNRLLMSNMIFQLINALLLLLLPVSGALWSSKSAKSGPVTAVWEQPKLFEAEQRQELVLTPLTLE